MNSILDTLEKNPAIGDLRLHDLSSKQTLGNPNKRLSPSSHPETPEGESKRLKKL